MSRHSVLAAAAVAALAMVPSVRAAVLINEFVYDDGGSDDREFFEIYNSGPNTVNIGNWVLRSSDTVAPPGDNNADVTIPVNTMLAPGAFWVIGQTGVPNLNQTVATIFENDNETTELLDDTGAVQDQITYERNLGATAVGPTRQPLWGNYNPADAGAGVTRYTVGRWVDGRDTLKNGQDFGVRLPTPGATNNPSGTITAYTAPSVSASGTGTTIPGYAFGFVEPRVIEPTVVDTNNKNAIPNPPNGETKVHTAWDPAGGGNGVVLNTPMTNGASFHILAYLDTNDIPINQNSSGVQFRGSEITMFGLGSADPSNPLTDLTGAIQLGAANLSVNGATGISWIYEKAGITGAGGASEKLHLVNTNASGNSNSTHASGLAWTILATFDLSAMSSDWYELAINIDSAGNGQAMFDGNVVNFTTIAGFAGGFYAGYRENLNLPTGATGVPTYVRPPTWTLVPEPAALSLLALGLPLAMRRRRS